MYHIRPPLVASAPSAKFTRDTLNRRMRGYVKMALGKVLAHRTDKVSNPVTGISDSAPLFVPNPHLCDAVNGRIVQSEIEGGVHLRDVVPGTVLEVLTQNRSYTIEYRGSGQALISGHPVFCPKPVLVNIHGSTWADRC